MRVITSGENARSSAVQYRRRIGDVGRGAQIGRRSIERLEVVPSWRSSETKIVAMATTAGTHNGRIELRLVRGTRGRRGGCWNMVGRLLELRYVHVETQGMNRST